MIGKKSNTSNRLGEWETIKRLIFGALSHDGKQFFRQYEKFDQYCFLDYIKQLHKKFGKIIVYVDRAPQHKSSIIKQYLEENDDVILNWFPKGSPQFNAVEEVWTQGKYNLLVSQYLPSLDNLKRKISGYYRTSRFNLDITKYMQREDG